MPTKYGVKIANYKVGSIYEYDLGVRNRYHYTDAMMTNSLFLYFLKDNGLEIKHGRTRDIIGVNFDYGSKTFDKTVSSYKKAIAKINKKEFKTNKDNRALEFLDNKIKEAKENESRYELECKNADILRLEYYTNGIDIKYPSVVEDGKTVEWEVVHYLMLFRSTGKAKEGSCMFICERLYDKAIDFLRMGYDMNIPNSPIVEMSAYSSLVCSTIVGDMVVSPEDIFVMKDIDIPFTRDVIEVGIDEQKHCFAKKRDSYTLKNTLFDGQCLIDDSVFPKWGNGTVLLRHHMCKMNGLHTYIQKFFRDYYGDKYGTAQIVDMFGVTHNVKDIKIITTDNAMKWIKFDITYQQWCDKVHENGNIFGIVKTPHQSKLGDVQRMSYQMVNALDIDIMDKVTETSVKYIIQLKKDNDVFLDYLEKNKNFSNDYEVLIALCERNKEFTRTDYFRDRKERIIRTYVQNFRFGKIIQNADNLIIVGSPYAMLLATVGEDVHKDDTFNFEKGTIQCWTSRFEDGEYLAEFRSPFNSKNNMGYLHNVRSENMDRYFELGREIIAVNMIGTDFQDRNSGSDQDVDNIYTTNQPDIVNCARRYYYDYPTIVNNISKDKKKYDYSLENYAIIDNGLASAQGAIGESSNLAQLCLTYTYNSTGELKEKYEGFVAILSVLAQVAIDNAKRKYDIDLMEEIERIKDEMDIENNLYPIFWKIIKDKKIKENDKKFKEEKINPELICPMNYIAELRFPEFKPNNSTISIGEVMNKYKTNETDRRRKSFKVEDFIEKYSIDLLNSPCHDDDNLDDYLLLKSNFDDLISDISKIHISSSYEALFYWLLNRAFVIGSGVKSKKINGQMISKTEKNKSLLVKTLYNINKKALLNCFKCHND